MLFFTLIASTFINFTLIAYICLRKRCDKDEKIKKQETENFLSIIFDSIPDALFVKDRYYKIVKANKKFLSLYPKEKRDNVIGHTTLEEYDPKEAEEFLAEDRKAFDFGYTKTIETINFPDGEKRTLLTQKTRFEDMDHRAFILGIATDISEQIKLQKDTEQSQAMLRMVTDFFPGLLFVKDQDFKIIYANNEYISRYPLEDQENIVGEKTLEYYSTDLQAEITKQDQETIRTGHTVKKKTITFPNGEVMEAIVNKRCFADSKGNEYILGIITKDELHQEDE